LNSVHYIDFYTMGYEQINKSLRLQQLTINWLVVKKLNR